MKINVKSEIGKLKKVLLHRPGLEVENITPSTMGRLLFEDAMYVKVAQAEHDAFAKILKDKGVQVYYIEELVAQTLDTSPKVKAEFISKFLHEADVREENVVEATTKYLNGLKTIDAVNNMIAGIYYDQIKLTIKTHLNDFVNDMVFVTEPMPNLLFTRDNFASVANGITLHKMWAVTRNRESLFAEFVFKYHPEFKDTPRFYGREDETSMEGGDILVLKPDTLGIGISQRTSSISIELLATRLFNQFKDQGIKYIYGFNIPKERGSMHLDTVLTMVDENLFSIFDDQQMEIYKIESDGKGGLKVSPIKATIADTLAEIFGNKVQLIKVANGHPVHAEREQWNDGANVLTIAPREIVVYNRNIYTKKLFEAAGVKVHEIPSSELSRGRGGPRCMSMPLEREDFKFKK